MKKFDNEKYKELKEKLNEGHVKDILKETMKRTAVNQFAKENFTPSKIPDQKIEQAFMIIDTHTRILDNINIINNYNITIQIISSIMMQRENWYVDEETCSSIINEYLDIYIDYSKIDETNEKEKLLREAVKKYIINSCMTYYAIYKKDKELLNKYNKKITEAISIILKEINPQRPQASQPDKSQQELPKEVLEELERKD